MRPHHDELLATVDAMVTDAECRNCGKPIFSLTAGVGTAAWRHRDEAQSRGCGAATFNPDSETGWDDTIPKKLTAAPKR